ncbi:MAG: nicotinamide mononucleotide transporter, partial [Oscillospiraceae bacterium]|nr:nicotinamide mononucleotide transporter [Oscillospiraceae bacterium]
MKLLEPFRLLTRFEWILWISSLMVVILSFILSGSGDVLNLIASLLGATALIFVSKGHVLGQVLTVVFAVFYGIISYHFTYYGEMITYLGMTGPMAVMAIISWLRHPYKDSSEVEVSTVSKAQLIIMTISALLVTAAFYFILKAFNNANLIWSTVSVTTSFIASYLTFLRSPFYGLGYAANDVILIILWVSASMQ